MARLNVTIVGSEKARLAVLHAGEDIRARLRKVVSDEATKLLVRSQAAFNAALTSRSGKLFASLTMRKGENVSWIGAYIGTSGRVGYIGRFFEKGYGGKTVRVRRTVKGLVEGARSRKARKLGTAGTFDRTLPFIQRPFLQPALDGVRSEITAALQDAVEKARVDA